MRRPFAAALGLYALRPSVVAAIAACGAAAALAVQVRDFAMRTWLAPDAIVVVFASVVTMLTAAGLSRMLQAQLLNDRVAVVPGEKPALHRAAAIVAAAFLVIQGLFAARAGRDPLGAAAVMTFSYVIGYAVVWMSRLAASGMLVMFGIAVIRALVRQELPSGFGAAALLSFSVWAAFATLVAVARFDPQASDEAGAARPRMLARHPLAWAWHILDGQGWGQGRALQRAGWAMILVWWLIVTLYAMAEPAVRLELVGAGMIGASAISALRCDRRYMVLDALRPISRRRFAVVVLATLAIAVALQWLFWWTCCTLLLSVVAPESLFAPFMRVAVGATAVLPLLVGASAIIQAGPHWGRAIGALALAAAGCTLAHLAMTSGERAAWAVPAMLGLGVWACWAGLRCWRTAELA